MDPDDYRQLQLSKVTGNTGTTPLEILWATTILPLTILTASLWPKRPVFISDFTLIVIPIIAVVTDLFWATPLLFVIIAYFYLCPPVSITSIKEIVERPVDSLPQWILNFRATTFLVTGICIMAVDFQMFPARFTKTETYGYGLMDLGVGFFVFCHGLVYKEKPFKLRFKTIGIFLCFGMVRLITTRSVDYQVHVSEYGVHWNFFFTLASCHAFYALKPRNFLNDVRLAVVLTIIQLLCLNGSVVSFIFEHNERTNLLTANIEGIVSILGYLSIFQYAIVVRNVYRNSRSVKEVFVQLLVCCVCAWLFLCVLAHTTGVSRRLCNTGYVAWAVAMSITLLLQLIAVDVYLKAANRTYLLPTLFSIQANGAFYFILTNVMTGLVNLSVQTMLLDVWQSYLVLGAYCLVSTAITYVYCTVTGYFIVSDFFKGGSRSKGEES